MAGETELRGALVGQHVAVDGAMGIMAGVASFDPNGAVLINIGSLFVGVAFKTGLLVESAEVRSRGRLVVFMTICALDHSLADSVPLVEQDLCSNFPVAG